MKPTVLALDISTSTGIAFGVAGEAPRFTTIKFEKGRPDPEQFDKMLRATRFFLDKFKPDIVAFEAPIGGERTSHFLVGVTACFQGEAARLGYSPVKIAIATVRKHFIGKHVTSRHFLEVVRMQNRHRTLTEKQLKAKATAEARKSNKSAVVGQCYGLGWKVRNDDEGDACAIFSYASATLGRAQAAPLGQLFTHERSAT